MRVTVLPDGPAAVQATRALKAKPYLDVQQHDPRALIQARATANDRIEAHAEEIRVRARAALEQARTAFRTLSFDQALSLLGQAQAALVPVAETEQDFALLSQLFLQQGINRLTLKQDREAIEAFTSALFLGYPGPQPGQHPPEVEALIKGAARRLRESTRGGVTVAAHPPGSQVWVDGKKQGESPVTVQVPPGPHHLRVTHFGHQGRALIQQVTAGKMERLEIYLKPLPLGHVAYQLDRRQRSGQRLDKHDPAILRRVLGPDKALVHVEKQAEQVEASLHWLGTPRVQVVDRPCVATRAEALADCLGPTLYHLASGKPYRPPAATERATSPVYRRWWFWTLVAAGAAGAAGAGIYFGTRDTGGTNVDIVSAK